jgi:hypothetical protein
MAKKRATKTQMRKWLVDLYIKSDEHDKWNIWFWLNGFPMIERPCYGDCCKK